MKSEIITKEDRRWYDDACGTALAMELVGERWSMLIVRELMFGPRRFGELKADLAGISANVLTQRLAGMATAGIVRKRQLAPPANVTVYELTPWGYESERAIQELGRWAVRSPAHDPTLPLSGASLMMSFRTMFSVKRSGGWSATIGFLFGRDGFVVTIVGDTLTVRRDDPSEAQVVLDSDPMTIASIVYGGRPIPAAEGTGVLRVTGDQGVFERFATLFPLPPKWTAA